MKRTLALAFFFMVELAFPASRISAESSKATTIIHSQPLHAGRINPRLFGNFIELLDDVVPAMWAEMLNDRSFEGVTKLSGWCYYDGAPDFCDREWDTNATWSYDTDNPFNGKRSARLSRRAQATRQFDAVRTRGENGDGLRLFRLFSGGQSEVESHRPVEDAAARWRMDDAGFGETPGDVTTMAKVRGANEIQWGTDRVVFEVRVEGEGSVWVDKLSLMPTDNVKGWRRDVVDVVKDVQPTLVRFGGSVCDPGEYRWKNGIGDRDLRVPFPNKVWGRLDPNDVGIDEFCQFCEVTGVEPLICLSFSDGPQNAADLVEYCNGDARTGWGAKRAANGHPAPYGVKYWQIGNEISGDDDNYVNRFGSFVELMKRADAGVAIMSSFPTQKLLDRVGKDIDYIAPHHYTADFG